MTRQDWLPLTNVEIEFGIDLNRRKRMLYTSALTLLFIGLKLTGHIDWAWVWVLCPIWIELLVGLTGLAVYLLLTRGIK